MNRPMTVTDATESHQPNINASSRAMRPIGMGRVAVRDMIASISES